MAARHEASCSIRVGRFPRRIATTIELDKAFYAAEAHHQDYLTLHPNQPYIAFNDLPKVENLKRTFPGVWRDKPTLVKPSA